ncbi:MAG: DUF262 domain-containing protein [Bacteroidia bacterium]
MEAKLNNLSRFIQNRDTQFVIPVYQRDYNWQEVQCQQLLRDIREVANNDALNSHFMGSIVHIQDSVYSTSSQLQLTIIDGQQRLTTISLLLLSIAHQFIEQGNEREGKRLLKNYIINEDYEEEKLKLRPVKKDDKALQYLIKHDFSAPLLGYSRITENYLYFKNAIPFSELDHILKGLNKLHFVEVSLERGKDDPQRIFESLNSTGLDLNQADLIRNYVLMDLNPKDQNRIYEDYWVKIEENTTDNKTKQPKLSEFIRDFITFKYGKIPNKGNVFQAFRGKYDFTGKIPAQRLTDIEQILVEIKTYSNYYYKLINNAEEPNLKIREHLRYINHLEINVAYPFLLQVYHDYTSSVIDTNTFIQVLTLIQSFVWRRFICSLPTNALNKIFMSLHSNVDKNNYLRSLELALAHKKGFQRFPKNNEVEYELKIKDFYNIKTKNRIYFLERLENFGKTVPLQIEGNEKVTTEHIFPQTPTLAWRKSLGDSFKLFEEQYKHCIANLTISGNNGELSNKPFVEKRDMPDVGYKDTGYWLNKYLANISQWTEPELLERLKLITERSLTIWSYPESVLDDNVSDEINIFDVETATNQKLEYYVFRDTQYVEKHFANMFISILKTLFEGEPKRFLTPEVVETLKLTQEKDSLRQAGSVGQSFFIETHYSANAILKKLKQVLELFDYSDELYLKFV